MRDHLRDARASCAAIRLTWSSTCWVRSSDGAVGQLHGDQQIALVLDRQEAGRHPRKP